ncbi:YdhK family protein [Niallia sp. 03133]|uniref:YdhK family protein n=1 Tax=Niallia sp. 03133 TaxID=3458060 RepID=UPI004044A980
MKRNKLIMSMFLIISMIILAACSSSNEKKDTSSHENMDMEEMHSGTGELPEGLKVKENPTYKVGSQAIINADHMKGMNGAEATIIGAYDTTVYAISYTPTNGGEKVTNHKWVIQEEIENAGDEPLKPGTEVTINADHMDGMDGAKAEIDSSEKTTVYMVDYKPTTGGKEVTNHQWVTESELSAK